MSTTPAARFGGLWVPIVTPFDMAGEVDATALRQLAERLLDDGVDGLVALGTTGEAPTLTAVERRQVVEICDQVCRQAGRGLMVGAGTNSTQGTIEEIEFLATGTDASAAMVVVPYYVRPSERAVIEHFNLVADESLLPLVLYNVPYRTSQDVSAAELLRASEHPNIVGLKQSVGALDTDTLEILASESTNFDVLAGDDAFIAASILFGAAGAISAAAHLCTPLFVEMVTAAQRHDVQRAVELSEALLPVVRAGFAEPNPTVWKGALAAQGELNAATVRRPLTAASADSVASLIYAAQQAQLGVPSSS